MSYVDRTVTNEQVIPTIESSLFVGNEQARFAIGILAVGEQVMPGREAEYEGYLRLRANVYADQTNMIRPEQVRDGIETDEDDPRAIHLGIVENLGDTQRVVGAMRVIIRGVDDRPLPVEEFFPEAFPVEPPASAVELSRFIIRHERAAVQMSLKWPLYAATVAVISDYRLGPTYAVVEEFLERDFGINGIPSKRIAEPKFVEEYNYDNLGVVIDVPAVAAKMEARKPGIITKSGVPKGEVAYIGVRPSSGQRTKQSSPELLAA